MTFYHFNNVVLLNFKFEQTEITTDSLEEAVLDFTYILEQSFQFTLL